MKPTLLPSGNPGSPRPRGPASQIDYKPSLTADEQTFLKVREYANVSEFTIRWYKQAFANFRGCTTKGEYEARALHLRETGRKQRSINSWTQAINCFHHWLATASDDKCDAGCAKSHLKLKKPKLGKRVLATFSVEQQARLLSDKREWYKTTPCGDTLFSLACGLAAGVAADRAQMIITFLLDTGARIKETVKLRWMDLNLDQLQVKLLGKGDKERIVPISMEGRKRLYAWKRKCNPEPADYVFATSTGSALSPRNAQRDIFQLCRAAGVTGKGVRCSPHTFRHTFAVRFLLNGGDIFQLKVLLGHTAISTTQIYLESIRGEDLHKAHSSFSPLAHLAVRASVSR